jgi:hypothetical protein
MLIRHKVRKTLGNRVLKLNNYYNESIVLLMELFGHSSVPLTMRYLGIREREILDVPTNIVIDLLEI